MAENFPRPNIQNEKSYNIQVRHAYLFLEDLKEIRCFIYNDRDSQEVDLIYSVPNFPKWYSDKDFKTFVYLTSKGLDYLEGYGQNIINGKLNESYKDVNRASLKNYTNQIIIGIITIALAGTSAYMSYQSNHKADATAISVDSLRLEIRKWRTQKTQTLSPLTLPPAAPHK